MTKKVDKIAKKVFKDVMDDIDSDSDVSDVSDSNTDSCGSSDDEDYVPPPQRIYDQREWLDEHAHDITFVKWGKQKPEDWGDEYISVGFAQFIETRVNNVGKRKYRYNWILSDTTQKIDNLYIIYTEEGCEYITDVRPDDDLFNDWVVFV